MKKPLYVRRAYEWSNPYTEPPEGKQRVMVEVFCRYSDFNSRELPPEIEAVFQFGDGYGATITFINEPPKQMSQEALTSIRQKRIRRRIEKKYPLFAEEMIAEEIALNPDYFNGITRADLQELKDLTISEEWARIYRIRELLGETK